MATRHSNPFVLPGLGQSGEAAQNPLLASMEMMRTAWEGLAKAGGFDQAVQSATSSGDDIERRIADLRVVEHWLQMNLSMLASTIQALEVQRSTISTLNTFFASAARGQPNMPAPWAAGFGGTQAGQSSAGAEAPADSSGLFGAPLAGQAGDTQGDASVQEAAERAQDAMQGWWNVLQAQFDNIAEATAASLKSAESMQQSAAAAAQPSSAGSSAAGKATGKTAARKATAKKATKKTAAKKTAAKKSASKSSPSKGA